MPTNKTIIKMALRGFGGIRKEDLLPKKTLEKKSRFVAWLNICGVIIIEALLLKNALIGY